MKKTKFPKLSKKNQAKIEPLTNPTTSEEFFEQGSIDEESGDRWVGSDIAKSLRFYQKAYLNYLKSIQLSNDEPNLEAYYNSSRLIFQVYFLTKTDGLKLKDLNNIEEIFVSESIIQSLEQILRRHEMTIEVSKLRNLPVSNDLLYNTGIVYTEILESQQEKNELTSGELTKVYNLASEIFLHLIPSQLNELERFVIELQQMDDTQFVSSNNDPGEDQQELTKGESIQPTDLYETAIASYKLILSIYENATSNSAINDLNQLTLSLLNLTDKLSDELVNKYSEPSRSKNEMLANITSLQIDEMKIIRSSITGTLMSDVSELMTLWQDASLPNLPERYMVASDSLQTVLDRNDVTLESINTSQTDDKQLYWNCLSFQNTMLKKAQELLSKDLAIKRNIPSGVELNIGSLISQLSEVIIARSDIELTRSLIDDFQPSTTNSQVLLNNCKNLLKSAMNIANSNGGLREKVIEKLSREKRKTESVLRLCFLEEKSSIEQLDKILTRDRWVDELPNIKKLGIYDKFNVQNIY